ncbi:MAG TPA: NADP-dependent oxidoreductase [Candidatus Baltobacteraceae bacterium]|jgi:NADPH:quinone reductase-like Zn-dependent oxidoreductase|nr:NADP-dependent oxidoreductase [Candidatus Baltobacteraceae bacterium]
MMKAIVVHQYGGPEVLALEDAPVPVPGLDAALVRVAAAGVGPWDALIRTGTSGMPVTLPVIPGSDIAGVVESVGANVTSVKPGDAVFGVTNESFTGGYAQYALASAASIAAKPQSLDFMAAASVPVVAATAWQMLFERAKVAKGQTVLVHGAAGNVGSYAVQLAIWAGARVVAVAGARDAEYVKSVGATDVIDFHAQTFENLVSNVDAVIDTVGGETQERSFSVLRPGGALISSVSSPSQELAARFAVRVDFFIVRVPSDQLERIAQLLDDGTLKADVGTVLRLDQARTAHEMLAGKVAHARGKIVLGVTSADTGSLS